MRDPSGIDPTDPGTWPTHCPDPSCGTRLWRTRQCLGHKAVQVLDDNGDPVTDPDTGEPVLAREHCGNCARRGATVCVFHGGRAPAVAAAADRRVEAAKVRRTVATYGLPVEVDPLEALLAELYRTAGHVAWLGELIAGLEHEDDPEPAVLGEGGDRDPQPAHTSRSGLKQYTRTRKFVVEGPSVWLELYQAERRHLASVSTALLKAGVDERRVRLAEDQAVLMADVLREFARLRGLDLAAPDVAADARRAFAVIEGGRAA